MNPGSRFSGIGFARYERKKMKSNQNLKFIKQSCLSLTLAALTLPVLAQQPSTAERVAELKASLAASKVILKQYEWIETTVVSLKGEEKSRKQQRCYYGADGVLQKVDVSESPEPAKKRGLRGLIARKKKEELTDYMKRAVSLVKSYVPPDPAKLQAAKDAGNVSIEILEPGKRARLNFKDYVQPGDNLAAAVDLTNNRLMGLRVSTYLDEPKDSVMLNVHMGQLNDGTTYANTITLDAAAKHLQVQVVNSGYRKTN
jgi:hypothetical protein